jgi:hypothetical protein
MKEGWPIKWCGKQKKGESPFRKMSNTEQLADERRDIFPVLIGATLWV